MTSEENPFAYVTDQDDLVGEDRDAYFAYWASRTSGERFSEIYRLNRLKWGDEVFDRGMDKSKIEVVDMKTGEVIETIYNSKMVNN